MTPEQLKASILQYAMEGKLVKQDPNDEPASELLKKIENEKAKLVKEGKINKERAVRPVKEEEKDGVLPTGWTYTRFQNISLFTTDYVANGSFKTLREHTHKYKEKNYALFVRTMDLSANFKSNLTYIDKDSYDFLSKSKLFGGELILPNIGGSIGKAFLMPNLNMPMSLAPNSIMVKFTEQVMNKYFSYFIQSPMGKSLLLNNKGGTATPKFSKTELRNMVLKLPPLEEQKRIVAKIEKLMPLVDEYAESYNRLQKIDNEFEDKLKQSVLQYAMEGKLVKQNLSDEPASELIKKIENEKAELIKEGKIKKSKKLPSINDDEKPFDIPDSWEWVRLGNVANVVMGQAPKSAYVNINGKGIEFHQGKSYFTENIIGRSEKYAAMSNKIIDSKYIVMAVRAPVGDVNLLNREISIGRGLAGIRPYISDKDYIFYYLRLIKKYFEKNSTGSTFKAINGNIIKNTPIPLPALEEQRRIVIKIKELMDAIN
ncbi:restriction endonuclease subunit S [Lactobacillus crispatus]|uniref:restriction endonuclease subunit S n=1 Tax=Lactobacillus crispatus TaxID=47770 RepID=UPI00195CB146|nr:restriction endonuclease subunit S [Lactobacillus crispatus]MBM6873905.1 restriction endonuclease subunit S [Lactobacillus crispatus]